MSEDKRTKIGATGPVRTPAPMNPTPAPVTGGMAVQTTDPGAHSYLPPSGDPLVGTTLANRYLIQKKLGEGGMGAVYLATHNLLEKQVALKILRAEFSRKQDLIDRFIQEAKAASRVRHENVIDISDFGQSGDYVFFAMELLKGHDLNEEIARARLAGQLLPWSRSKKIFLQICSALAAAHAQGIIHRDLKPENVYLVEFLGDPDFVKLLDFGIAKLTEVSEGDRKLTRTGMLFGTPEYMSPEQARGEPQVDARVDVYAMGCILFQLVTGRVPFEAENFMGVLSLHLTELPPIIPDPVFDRIGAPRELGQVIDKALVKDRDQRWQSITELANAVRQVCGDPIPTATGVIPAQARAASVPAPATTTERPPSRPPSDAAAAYRQRTQWTGNLSVPVEEGPAPKKSKLPLILGGVLVAGAAAATAVVLMSRGEKTTEPGGGSPVGKETSPSGSGPSGSQVATASPDAAPAPPPETGEKVDVTIETTPQGARVKDLLTGAWLPDRTTPMTFKITKGTTPRGFQIQLDGFEAEAVEVLPDKARTEKVTLKKSKVAAGSNSGSAKPPGKGSQTGSQGSAKVTPTQGSQGSATPTQGSAPPPPKKDPCDDLPPDQPCIKTVFPTGSGS